jgi:hypothetical protein
MEDIVRLELTGDPQSSVLSPQSSVPSPQSSEARNQLTNSRLTRFDLLL